MEGDALTSPYRRFGVCDRFVLVHTSHHGISDWQCSRRVERRRNVRSSIADLRVLYANQMQNLHTQIEGSSKFIPTTPGRHVILEMDSILALNPATYKVDHSVRFVLLDDAVLVARRRRRRNNSETDKLIAERCWPLNDMLVLDTKDTACTCMIAQRRILHLSCSIPLSDDQCVQDQT